MGQNAKKSREKKLARDRQRVHVNGTAPYADRVTHSRRLLIPVRSPVKGVKRVVHATTCVRVGDGALHGQGLFATSAIRADTDLLLEFELCPPSEVVWQYQQLKEQGVISGGYDHQVPLIAHMLMLTNCERASILAYYHSSDVMSVHPLILEQVSGIPVQYATDFCRTGRRFARESGCCRTGARSGRSNSTLCLNQCDQPAFGDRPIWSRHMHGQDWHDVFIGVHFTPWLPQN